MTIFYKLTTRDRLTWNSQYWDPGYWVEAAPGPLEPCTSYALHGYTHPILALLLNPAHGNHSSPRLWTCEFEGQVRCDGTKVYGKKQRIIQEIPIDSLGGIPPRDRALFAVMAASSVQRRGLLPEWQSWADLFLFNPELAQCCNDHGYGSSIRLELSRNRSLVSEMVFPDPTIKYTGLAAEYAFEAGAYLDSSSRSGIPGQAAYSILMSAKAAQYTDRNTTGFDFAEELARLTELLGLKLKW